MHPLAPDSLPHPPPRHAAVRVSSSARPEDFLGIKRTQLKRGADQGVSEKQDMEALHIDRSRMLVQVQGADKHGDGSRRGSSFERGFFKFSLSAVNLVGCCMWAVWVHGRVWPPLRAQHGSYDRPCSTPHGAGGSCAW